MENKTQFNEVQFEQLIGEIDMAEETPQPLTRPEDGVDPFPAFANATEAGKAWDGALEEVVKEAQDKLDAVTAYADTVGSPVCRPNHYTRFSIEPVTFIMENDLSFVAGNIIKYITRAGHKMYDGLSATDSEIVDLEKVRRYAEMRINQLNGEAL